MRPSGSFWSRKTLVWVRMVAPRLTAAAWCAPFPIAASTSPASGSTTPEEAQPTLGGGKGDDPSQRHRCSSVSLTHSVSGGNALELRPASLDLRPAQELHPRARLRHRVSDLLDLTKGLASDFPAGSREVNGVKGLARGRAGGAIWGQRRKIGGRPPRNGCPPPKPNP